MMGLSTDINLVAILVATFANMVLGMMWYSTSVLGDAWMDLSGMRPKNKKEEDAMKAGMMGIMVKTAVLSFLMAYVLAHFVSLLGLNTGIAGAELGFWLWLGFTGSVMLSNHLYSNDPIQLWYINAGYRLVAFMVMGAILAMM